MGQVARTMNQPHGNMYDNTLPNSDTSTISSSGESSSTHSPDSNTMLMDKYPHITSSDNLLDSLPQYYGDKKLMESAGKDDDDICLQNIPGCDKDSGNTSKELWNEYRPGLLHYPSLQSKMLSPFPGIFHSLQLRNSTDAQSSATTTADRIAALRSQYNIHFDSEKNDDTVRAIHVAIDELAAIMNAHSLLSDHTNHYPEEQLVKHPDTDNRIPTTTTTTTSTPSVMDFSIPKSSTIATSSNNTTPISSIEHVSPSQALHTPSSDQFYYPRTPPPTTTTTTTLPARFQFSFDKDSPSTACDDNNDHHHPTITKEHNQQTPIHQRKILPLPKPRVQRIHQQQQQQYSTPISSEFTFKSPYHPLSTHSKTEKKDIDNKNDSAMASLDPTSSMNNETTQDYTKKAKRSGDCYTDDEDEDGGMAYRSCNRYNTNKTKIGSSATRRSAIDSKNNPLDASHSLLPSTLLQNSFLRPLTTKTNGSSKSPSSSSISKSKPISSPPLPAQNKKNNEDKSPISSSSQTDNHRKNTINIADTSRHTRRKQLVSPSTLAATSTDSSSKLSSPPTTTTLASSIRRKGKKGGQGYDDTNKKKNDNNRLDLVTSTLGGPDDWICLFCQYEIFKKGWFMAKRKHLIQEQQQHRQRRLSQKRLIDQRSTLSASSLVDQQQQIKDNGPHGGKMTRSHGRRQRRLDSASGGGSHGIIRQLDTNPPVT